MSGKESPPLERGEYVLGMAILIAAMLVSFAVYYGADGVRNEISKLKLTVNVPSGAAAQAQQPAQPAQPTPAAPAQPQGPVGLSAFDFTGAAFEGSANGKVVFVEYSDFECPFCGRVQPTLTQLKAAYPDAKYYFRHFPLSFHQYAQKSAEAAECAGKQGKFWGMHDLFYADQSALSVADAKAHAATLGLDTAAFNACLDSGETASRVSAQQDEGASVGIQGTPGFVIYSSTPKAGLEAKLAPIVSKLSGLGVGAELVSVDGAGSGLVFAGALPYANFKEVMDAFN